MADHRQITLLKGVTFAHYGSKAIVTPFFPLFLLYQGFSSFEIGMIMGITPIVSIVAQPLFGFWSDKYRTIKKILLILHACIIAVGFGVFFSQSFWIVFVSVLVLYFVWSPCTPLIDSLGFKILKGQHHEYGKIRLWGSIGYSVIAVVSGPVLQWIGIGRIGLLFWALFLLMLFSLLFLKDQDQSMGTVSLRSVSGIFRNREFLWFLLFSSTVMISNQGFNTMIVLHLHLLDATTLMVGLAWALAAISEVPVFYYLAKRLSRYKEFSVLGIVAVLYAIRWWLYSMIESAWVMTIFQLSQGLTFGLFWLVALQLTVRVFPDHLRSTGQAMLASSFGVAGAIGGPAGGWVLDHWGPTAMYQWMAVITLLPVIFIFVRVYQRK